MGVKYLLDYLELKSGRDEPIDLIKVARTLPKDEIANGNKSKSDSKLTLVVDGESCLNRLYGGFHSDWICGGQWTRMATFIRDLVTKLNQAKIEMVVFFNGAIEPQRMNEWISMQKGEYHKMCYILKDVEQYHSVPKFKWVAPVGLRSAIRMMLREMNVNVVSTIDDHRQEVIAYCRENNFYGLLAEDAEYIAFHPTRLFSAKNLKLRYRGTLETKEFKISEFMQEFGLTNEKLCVLAALLGNYLLPEKDLKDVLKKANINMEDYTKEQKKGDIADDIIPKLAKFINQLNVTNDLDDLVQQILGNEDPRAPLLKQSIQYYLNGTKDGFLKYRSVSTAKPEKVENAKDSNNETIQEPDLDTTALASEIAGVEKNILNEFDQASACLDNERDDSVKSANTDTTGAESEDSKSDKSKLSTKIVLPHVSHEVMRTLSERHSKGLMSPLIYQILSQGEIKLPVLMQNLQGETDIPNIYEFYKPIRQMVYAIVFNLHHHKFVASKEKKPLEVDIRIKEWVFSKDDKVHKAEYVKAVPVGWGVPTIQRLWFGTLQDDKRRRLRAFLTCMRSDVQLILNPDFVPQELLMAAVVLRYIMSFPEQRILRKQELDAFIVTALTLELMDADAIQKLSADPINSRSIVLAVLFMKGVEMALLVNDACGAPIPWLMCCPWLFFDGRLFNNMFQKALSSKNLQELCSNRLGIVLRAERMRQAILEGLSVQFERLPLAKSPFGIANADMNRDYSKPNYRMPPFNLNRAGHGDSPRGRPSLGGSLSVAGVVVGHWASNSKYNIPQPSYEVSSYIPPPHQISGNSNFDNYGYRSRSAFNFAPKGKPYKFYPNKKSDIKPKDKKPSGRGRGRGRGMTIGSSSSTVTDNNLPNGNEKNDVNNVFDSSTVPNGGATSTFTSENDESNTSTPMNETSSSLPQAMSSE